MKTSTGSETDVRICFVGDSFVNGTGDEAALGWAGRLCAAAAGAGVPITYYNLGVRRDTSAGVRSRWRIECTPRLPDGCDGRIVLSCGVNDTSLENDRPRVALEASCAHVRGMLEDGGGYDWLLVGPPPVADDTHNARIERLSTAFSELAGALDVPYIEVFSELVGDPVYRAGVAAYDGAHPRSTGYERMAALIGSSPKWWFGYP